MAYRLSRLAATTLGVALFVSACATETIADGPPLSDGLPVEVVATTTTDRSPSTTTTELETTLLDAGALEDRVAGVLAAYPNVPGLAVAVVRDGEAVMVAGIGQKPTEEGVDMPAAAVTADTLFQVGSVSKPVTAMAVAALVDEGVVGWDDDVDALLTAFDLPNPFPVRVTIAQLLSHTGGTNVSGFLGYEPGTAVPSTLDVLAGAGNSLPIVVESEPGTRYAYSGGGYTLMQQAIADRAGTTFADLLDRLVLDPSGMTASTFAQPLPTADVARSTAGSFNGVAVDPRVHPELAAAGLWSTAPDLASFVLEVQRALQGESDVVASTTAAFLVAGEAPDFSGWVAHGFFVDREDDPTWFWHEGRNVGFNAYIAGSTDGRHGIAVLTNATDAGALIGDVLCTVGEAEGWATGPVFR